MKTLTTKLTALTAASTAALIFGAGSALAVEQSVIDGIVDDLAAQGFSRIEIEVGPLGLDVDAYGAGREGDFYYTRNGWLLSSDIDREDDQDEGGSQWWQASSYSDADDAYDRWDDDDYDDDDDDDDDDYDDD